MNGNDREKLIRVKRRLEQRVDAHRKEAAKMQGSPENAQYHYGARDEADKILRMFMIEFNNELRVTDISPNGEML